MIVVLAITIASSLASASEVPKNASLKGVGTDNPPSVEETLDAQFKAAGQVGDVVQHAPGGTALQVATIGVQIDAIRKQNALNAATLNLIDQNPSLQRVHNKPYVIDLATGQVFHISLKNPGELVPAFKLQQLKGNWQGTVYSAPEQFIFKNEANEWIYFHQ